ncbi:hypothetical protein HFD88_006218 [Aspergillus terreus]|nr:hypothetical protein HFD88_006218 [Aspergillus terreus]
MDLKLPECINTEEKQRNLAEALTARHYNKQILSSELVSLQGAASVTLEVVMEGDLPVIIQFRTEAFDTTAYRTAKEHLSEMVPSIELIQSEELPAENVFCVFMAKMPGKPWMEVEDCWKEDEFCRCAMSLGQLLSRCFVSNEVAAIDTYIIPGLKRIQTIRSRSGVDVTAYFPLVEKLITAASRLQDLPGLFSHQDLNTMNIFADESGQVRGIVDWEDSRALPFGLCGWAIHFLAGESMTAEDGDIEFRERPVYETMETAFWESLLEGAAQDVSKELRGRMEDVQLAVIIGTVLRILGVYEVNGVETTEIHVPSLNALPKLLRYRIPFVRGPQDKPFSDEDGKLGWRPF